MQTSQAMNVDAEKARLNNLLDEALNATMAALEGIDGDKTIVYEKEAWRPKDVVGHIAAYDAEIVTSLQAYRDGGEYKLSILGEQFNAEQHEKHKNLPAAEIYREWAEARDRVKAAISAMPASKFDGQLLFPWGTRGTISFLVDDTIAHETDHRNDILKLRGH